MENEKHATAIDEANFEKLVQYHDNGWRFGYLWKIGPDNIQIKKVTGGFLNVKRDDVRLVIQEPEKPKAIHLSADGTPSKAALAVPVGEVTPDVVSKVNATIAKAVASSKPKLFGGGIVAIDKAAKTAKRKAAASRKFHRNQTGWKPEYSHSGKPEKQAKPKAAKKAARKPAKKSKTTPPENVHFNAERIVKLYDRGKGKSVSEIAQTIGYEKGKGNNRVANALIKAGVFKGTRTQQ